MALNANLSGGNNPENENATLIASVQNQLSQLTGYVQSLDFGNNQILTPGVVSSSVGIASTSSPATVSGLLKFVSHTTIFSNTPMNNTTWTTVAVPVGITGATTLIGQVNGSAENVTPQSQLQVRKNPSDGNVLIIAVGVDPAPGNVSDFSFVQPAFIPVDTTAQSFQYQVTGPATGGCFSNLTLIITGYQ